jgi:hypothetical protein
MPPAPTVINNDPFCDVDLLPLEETQGKYAVVRLKNAETGSFVPLDTKGAIHGRDYRLVPNTLINQLAQDVLTKTEMPFELLGQASGSTLGHTVWDGKKFARRWVIKQPHADDQLGTLMMGVEAVNSYDGSFKVGLQFFFIHTSCINQFHSGNLMGSFVFSHFDHGDRTLDADIEQAVGAVGQQAKSFASVLPKLRELLKPMSNGTDSLSRFLAIRGELAAETPAWPQSYDGDVLDELRGCGPTARLKLPQRPSVASGKHTLWDLLNAYTAVTTHKVGGFRGANLSRMVTDHFVARAPAWGN